MEIRLVIFLAFTAVTVVSNSALIWFMYKGFSEVTAKLTGAVREFQKNDQTRAWIASLQSASERAVTVTEITRKKLADYDPKLEKMQAHYEFTLAKVDVELERIADGVSDNAIRVRDAVADPAEKLAGVAAGLQDVFGFTDPDDL